MVCGKSDRDVFMVSDTWLRRRASSVPYILTIVAIRARAKKLSGKLGVDIPFYNNDVEVIIQLSCQLSVDGLYSRLLSLCYSWTIPERIAHKSGQLMTLMLVLKILYSWKRVKRIVMKMMMLLLHDDYESSARCVCVSLMTSLRNEKMDPQIRGWSSPQMHFATAGEVGMQELK